MHPLLELVADVAAMVLPEVFVRRLGPGRLISISIGFLTIFVAVVAWIVFVGRE